jgi:hypothetical protein
MAEAANKLTISWVRHAESFSNILEGNITDFYDFMKKTGGKRPLTNLNNVNENKEYEEKFKKMIAEMKTLEIEENVSDMHFNDIKNDINNYKNTSKYYELYKNDEIVKLCQEKNTKELKIKQKSEKVQMDLCKMRDDINKFDLDQWIWDGYNEEIIKSFYKKNWSDEPNSDIKPPCTWIFTPTLTYNGVRQALKLGEEYFNKSKGPNYDFATEDNEETNLDEPNTPVEGGGVESYDAMICSASVRTIMTALFSILNSFGTVEFLKNEANKLYIVPYINEKYNGSGEFDNANKTIPIDIIDTVITYIIEFVIEVSKNKYTGLEFKNTNLAELTNEMLTNFIDTSHYKKLENLDPKEYSEGDYEKFVDEFLHEFLTDMNMTNTPHILAFSHGKNIEEDVKNSLKKEYLIELFNEKNDEEKKLIDFVAKDFFPNNCSVWKVNYIENTNKYSIDYQAYLKDDKKEKFENVFNVLKKTQKIVPYFTRNTKIDDNDKFVEEKIESVGYPFPSYLGGFTRTNEAAFDNENNNFVNKENYWCSLKEDKLRGKIVKKYPHKNDGKSYINEYNTSITWVRHGESIAQMIEAANDDAPLDKDKVDFQKNVVNAIRKKELKSYERFEKQLKTAYIESNDLVSKLKKFDKLPYMIDDDTKDMVLDVNDKQQSKFLESKYDKYTPASWFFTPTLTYVGVEEAKQFGKTFWAKNSDNYNLIISSPTVRTIMTAIYASISKHLTDVNIPPISIVIMPQINEEYAPTPYLDRANAAIPHEIIEEVIERIKKFIKDDYKDIDIEINTDFYITKANEANNIDDFYNGNFEEAQKYIQEYIKEKNIENNGKTNILAFVHANFIGKRLNKANEVQFKNLAKRYFPNNCSAYQLYYNLKDTNETPYNRFTIKYNNNQSDFRNKEKSYDEKKEEKDENDKYWTLNKGSLRGDINDMWIRQCYDDNGKNSCNMVSTIVSEYEKNLRDNMKGGKTIKTKVKTKRRPQRKTTLKRSRKNNNNNNNNKNNKNKKTKNKKRTIQKRKHKRNQKTKHN